MNKPKSRLFISYSRHDESFVDKLASDLIVAGAEVWLDRQSIVPGANWGQSIQEGLDNTDRMLLVVTPDSMNSKNVALEWQYFFDNNKEIIPLRLSPAKLSFQINRLQYIDFHGDSYEVAFDQLCKRIGLRDSMAAPLHPSVLATRPFETIVAYSGDRIKPIEPQDNDEDDRNQRRDHRRTRRNSLTALVGMLIIAVFVGVLVAINGPAALSQTRTPTIAVTSTFEPIEFVGAAVETETQTPTETSTDSETPAENVEECPSLASRLETGQMARVISSDDDNGLRLGVTPGTGEEFVSYIQTDVVTEVIDGPVCKDNLRWWKLAFEQISGWGAEGKEDTYWLEPYADILTPTPDDCIPLPPRLVIGKKAKIINQGLQLQTEPGQLGSPFMIMSEGDVVTVLDGPVCNDDIRWWKIQYSDHEGWSGEGDKTATTYWIEPANDE